MIDQIVAVLSNPALAIALGFALEIALRLMKTDKPVSILRVVSGVLKGIIKVALALDALLDKVVPQNVVVPPSDQPPAA